MIKVNKVTKRYWLVHKKLTTFREKFVNLFNLVSKQEFLALDDVSFEVNEGECFGIIGRNGSGKSTLVKILANVFKPTTGTVICEGRVVPFIELGVGFNPELSGYDNVYLNGALIGLSKKQIKQVYNEIVEFAGLEQFMDQKLKYYSSGMVMRLAFSIAMQADSDILLLDEVLAVGDVDFQKKCADKFDDFRAAKKTIVLVTHDLDAIKKYCDKVLYLESGKLKMFGSADLIVEQYLTDNQ
jgi:ABC-2 type transport system ATP-binding protein